MPTWGRRYTSNWLTAPTVARMPTYNDSQNQWLSKAFTTEIRVRARSCVVKKLLSSCAYKKKAPSPLFASHLVQDAIFEGPMHRALVDLSCTFTGNCTFTLC